MRAGSGTQKVIATSSAEAEFYAGARSASAVLGANRLMFDLGVQLDAPLLLMDATGGIGIASRRGLGPVKHLATASLWLQAVVFRRELELGKVGTEENVADAGTKALAGPALRRHVEAMGYERREGRSGIALESAWAAAVRAGNERTDNVDCLHYRANEMA